jgi:membrane protease YdiL (CAAX protease family)
MDQAPLDVDLTMKSSPRKGQPLVAWVFIILAIGGTLALRQWDQQSEPEALPNQQAPAGIAEDPLGVLLMEMQAKYMVGAAAVAQQDPDVQGTISLLYSTAQKTLDSGTIPQRQRFVVLAGELMGPAEAADRLKALDDLIAREQAAAKSEAERSSLLRETESELQKVLHRLFDGSLADDPDVAKVHAQRAASLSLSDRNLMVDQLGWLGRLALLPPGTTDATARDAVIGPAVWLAHFLSSVTFAALAVGLMGFVGLVIVVVLACTRQFKGGVVVGHAHHGVYAETFAIWMFAFFGLQLVVGKLGELWPHLLLLFELAAFFSSLGVLAWPVLRGVPWKQVREDIGWRARGRSWVDPAFGVMGYAMALPILGIGLIITLGAMAVQKAMAGPGPIFGPTAGPAHPIILQLAGPDIWPKIQVLCLAVIAAPLVEETMFRGVLYRHLREASAGWGVLGSVFLSGTISAFIFAVIHPQGIVAVPALMSLAYAFALMREWRGALLPSMVMHGISNFLVLSGVILAFRA